MGRLILASASPRRLALLRQLGFAPEVQAADVDESAGPGELPSDYVRRIAATKAVAVAPGYAQALVLAADTTVVSGNRMLGKPADAVQAEQMLKQLSGAVHQVWTGVCLLRVENGETVARQQFEVVSEVCFRALTSAEINAYVATSEPLDKAGAYAIQGRGAMFVSGLTGSYSAVVGLPLCETATALSEFGCSPWP